MVLKSRSLMSLVLMFTVSGIVTSGSLAPEETQKLIAGDGGFFHLFGSSVAVDGQTAAVGALLDDDNGLASGSVYVYVRSGGVWTRQTKLRADDGAAGDLFGISVSIWGDTVAVGAAHVAGTDGPMGAVYIFVRDGGEWTQEARLVAADGAVNDLFGTGVAVHGDTVIVGAESDEDNGPASGSAYVFIRAEGVWTQQEKLLPDVGAANDRFGHVVSFDGETVVIGTLRFADGRSGSGSAYIFSRPGGVWIQQARLVSDNPLASDRFGNSVSVDGRTVVIGSGLDDDRGENSGSAYVYSRAGGAWSLETKLFATDGMAGDRFGGSVSVHGSVILIGASGAEDNGENSGSAYVFTHLDDMWGEEVKFLAGDGAPGDAFGNPVAVANNTVLIGAIGDDDEGDRAGAAYVFRLTPPDPVNLILELMDLVENMSMVPGIDTSMHGKLNAALMVLTDLSMNNDTAALHLLGSFAAQVEALGGKQIAAEDADDLIAAAREIIQTLGME